MAKKYEPYSVQQAVELYARYYGMTKAEAARQLSRNSDTNSVRKSLIEIEKGLQMESKKAFLED